MSEAFGTAIDESRSADIHFSVRPSRVLREGAKNGASRRPRGARTHLQGGTVATLAGVDGDDAVERRADAAEAREAKARKLADARAAKRASDRRAKLAKAKANKPPPPP